MPNPCSKRKPRKPAPSPIDRMGWSGKSRNVRLKLSADVPLGSWQWWQYPYAKPLTSAEVDDDQDTDRTKTSGPARPSA